MSRNPELKENIPFSTPNEDYQYSLAKSQNLPELKKTSAEKLPETVIIDNKLAGTGPDLPRLIWKMVIDYLDSNHASVMGYVSKMCYMALLQSRNESYKKILADIKLPDKIKQLDQLFFRSEMIVLQEDPVKLTVIPTSSPDVTSAYIRYQDKLFLVAEPNGCRILSEIKISKLNLQSLDKALNITMPLSGEEKTFHKPLGDGEIQKMVWFIPHFPYSLQFCKSFYPLSHPSHNYSPFSPDPSYIYLFFAIITKNQNAAKDFINLKLAEIELLRKNTADKEKTPNLTDIQKQAIKEERVSNYLKYQELFDMIFLWKHHEDSAITIARKLQLQDLLSFCFEQLILYSQIPLPSMPGVTSGHQNTLDRNAWIWAFRLLCNYPRDQFYDIINPSMASRKPALLSLAVLFGSVELAQYVMVDTTTEQRKELLAIDCADELAKLFDIRNVMPKIHPISYAAFHKHTAMVNYLLSLKLPLGKGISSLIGLYIAQRNTKQLQKYLVGDHYFLPRIFCKNYGFELPEDIKGVGCLELAVALNWQEGIEIILGSSKNLRVYERPLSIAAWLENYEMMDYLIKKQLKFDNSPFTWTKSNKEIMEERVERLTNKIVKALAPQQVSNNKLISQKPDYKSIFQEPPLYAAIGQEKLGSVEFLLAHQFSLTLPLKHYPFFPLIYFLILEKKQAVQLIVKILGFSLALYQTNKIKLWISSTPVSDLMQEPLFKESKKHQSSILNDMIKSKHLLIKQLQSTPHLFISDSRAGEIHTLWRPAYSDLFDHVLRGDENQAIAFIQSNIDTKNLIDTLGTQINATGDTVITLAHRLKLTNFLNFSFTNTLLKKSQWLPLDSLADILKNLQEGLSEKAMGLYAFAHTHGETEVCRQIAESKHWKINKIFPSGLSLISVATLLNNVELVKQTLAKLRPADKPTIILRKADYPNTLFDPESKESRKISLHPLSLALIGRNASMIQLLMSFIEPSSLSDRFPELAAWYVETRQINQMLDTERFRSPLTVPNCHYGITALNFQLSPFGLAIAHNWLAGVSLMADQLATSRDLYVKENETDIFLTNVLRIAIHFGHIEMVKLLLSKLNIDVHEPILMDEKDSRHYPLACAIWENQLAIGNYLVEKIGKPKSLKQLTETMAILHGQTELPSHEQKLSLCQSFFNKIKGVKSEILSRVVDARLVQLT